jgi:hypothetical protein
MAAETVLNVRVKLTVTDLPSQGRPSIESRIVVPVALLFRCCIVTCPYQERSRDLSANKLLLESEGEGGVSLGMPSGAACRRHVSSSISVRRCFQADGLVEYVFRLLGMLSMLQFNGAAVLFCDKQTFPAH